MNHFLIAGLPRSRTAWLAAFLTCGPVHCWHDAIRTGEEAESMRNLSWPEHSIYRGISDSGLCLWMNTAENLWPSAARVVIRRNPEECLASFQKWAGLPAVPEPLWNACVHGMETAARKHGALVVDFADMDARLEEIWKWVTLGALPFPKERAELFLNLNVQAKPPQFP